MIFIRTLNYDGERSRKCQLLLSAENAGVFQSDLKTHIDPQACLLLPLGLLAMKDKITF